MDTGMPCPVPESTCRARRGGPRPKGTDMNPKNASLVAVVGSALAAGSLMFAGPAAAHTGGHVGTQAGGGMHAELPIAESGSRIGMELPIAPIGTAGPGRVPMTALTAVTDT